MLEKPFQLKAHNTPPRTEMLAALTTFLSLTCIGFLNA